MRARADWSGAVLVEQPEISKPSVAHAQEFRGIDRMIPSDFSKP
jgi:hypothetical protein